MQEEVEERSMDQTEISENEPQDCNTDDEET